MNLLRYLLSLGILINHFNVLTGHNVPYFIFHDRIGGFFALSGFLMYHSYSKIAGLKAFVKHRAKRILPTYIFIVLISVMAGVFISDLGSLNYLLNIDTWKYLAANLTFLNWLHPTLPGVFTQSQFAEPTVNGSLWTMKVEWLLDLSVPLFVFIHNKTKFRKDLFAICIIVISIMLRCVLQYAYETTEKQIFEILSRQFFVQTGFFYGGMLIYFWRDKFNRYKKQIIATTLVLYIVGPFIPYGNIIIAPVSVPALVIGISMIGRTIKRFKHRNCISYNIYLLHFPVIQVGILFGINSLPLWSSLSYAIAATVILALFTNRFVDQKFMNRKSVTTDSASAISAKR
ncbi:MAG: acyltransferase [Candidatus Amulumruptor caecigallinarius]|nr:acyltransferase [Candidatus Amulumruptor caecigallinarius]